MALLFSYSWSKPCQPAITYILLLYQRGFTGNKKNSGISTSLMHWGTQVQEHTGLNVSASYITLIWRMILIFVGGVRNCNAILTHSGCFCKAYATGSVCVAVQGQHFNLISSDFLNCNTLKRWSTDAAGRIFHNFCLHSFIQSPQFWPLRYHAIADLDSTQGCFNKSHFAL